MNQEEYWIINIKDLMMLMLRRLPIILAAMVLCAGAMLVRVMYFVTPMYEAKATMIVSTRQDSSAAITNDQYSSARNWANTYSIVLKSGTMLQAVTDSLDLSIDYETLSSMISVYVVDNTQILGLTVTASDPQQALQIAKAMVALAPTILSGKVDAASISVISDARCNNQPINLGKKQPVILGAAMGMVLACAVILLAELLNNKIRSEEDITKYLQLPVLSVIPHGEMED